MIKYLLTAAIAVALCSLSVASAARIEAKIGLGITDISDRGAFFHPDSRFMQGVETHTNTVRFDDGVVEVAFTVTAQGFDASGDPAPLYANERAVGIGVGRNQSLDPGEKVKFTIDDITYSQIGPDPVGGMVDLASAKSFITSIRMGGNFNNPNDDPQVIDTYTYTGVGQANTTGDDTFLLLFEPATQLANDSMIRIRADAGSFRVLFISTATFYSIKAIPEPATVTILGMAMVGAILVRRRAAKK